MGFNDLVEQCGRVSGDQVSELALQLVNEWSPPGKESGVAQLLMRELRAVGVDEVYLDEEFPGSPSVICWLRGEHPGPTMQWHGHLDAIASPHSRPVLEGGSLKGRGACDMKGALAAMVVAVDLLRRTGFPRAGQLLLTFHGLHEDGGSRPLLRLIERGIVGDAVLIGELGTGTQLITSSGGLSFWDIRLDSGVDPVHETNAIEMPDIFSEAIRVHAELVQYSENVAARGGSLFVGKMAVGDYYNRVPVGGLISGTRRHTESEDLRTVRTGLVELVERLDKTSRVSLECRVDGITDAYRIDPECRIARALRSAVYYFTGETMYPRSTTVVGNAAHFVMEAGIPAVYYGANYATAHSNKEEVTVAELVRLVGVYALTTAAFLEPDMLPQPPSLRV